MRPDLFPRPIAFGDALARVLASVAPIERTATVSLDDAQGRVASSDVRSRVDVPPFDRAAMDGYAVRSADIAGAAPDTPARLTCVDRIFTGQVSQRDVRTGECAEIATGAPMPRGADAVVMVERTSRNGETVLVHEHAVAGRNVGRRGSDIATDQLAIRAGDVITPARAGSLAAVNCTVVDVYDRPTVAILSTGTEVVPPGEPLAPGQVHDVNGVTLAAIAADHGAVPHRLGLVDDSIDALVDALRGAAAYDAIVTSGGSSVGGRDLLIDALALCGSVAFHGIAIKPGKPTLFGHVGSTPIFGMPGNPTSCLSNAYILLVPFLRTVARLPAWRPLRLQRPLARPIGALADRHQFYAVKLVDDVVEPAFKSSGDITSLASADGYIEIPPGTRSCRAGDVVTVTML